MTTVHRFLGFAVVAGWSGLFLWGAGLFLLKRDAGRLYWGLLAGLQVTLVAQVLGGLAQLLTGARSAMMHYPYGAVLPGLVLVVCHFLTRGLDRPPYHAVFTIGAFVVAALTSRALATGLGIG